MQQAVVKPRGLNHAYFTTKEIFVMKKFRDSHHITKNHEYFPSQKFDAIRYFMYSTPLRAITNTYIPVSLLVDRKAGLVIISMWRCNKIKVNYTVHILFGQRE